MSFDKKRDYYIVPVTCSGGIHIDIQR